MEYNETIKKAALKWLNVLLFGCFMLQIGFAQGGNLSPTSIHFKDGIVMDTKRNEFYISNSEALVEALNIDTGEKKWSTSVKGKPLFIQDNVLFVQLEKEKPTSELEIVGLNIDNRGSTVLSISEILPKSVTCYFKGSPNGAFHLMPYLINNNIILEWVYRHPLNGEYIAEKERRIERGFLLFDKDRFEKIKPSNLPKNYNHNSIIPTRKNRIQESKGQQFLSKDGKHILVSAFASKPGIEMNYGWKIYDISTKKMVGKLRNNVSYAPFIVRKSSLIFEKDAYRIFNTKSVKNHPLELVWWNLNQNKILKSYKILDDTYTGPTPP